MIINNRATHRYPRKKPASRYRPRKPMKPTKPTFWDPSSLDEYIKKAAIIPRSTPKRLIFPYDLSKKKFDTSTYSILEDKSRVSLAKIEQFLNEVNVPVAEFENSYGSFARFCDGSIFTILCLIFFPIGIFLDLISCFSYHQHNIHFLENRIKATEIVRLKGNALFPFKNKGLEWQIPDMFPRWIELQINPRAQPNPAVSSPPKVENTHQSKAEDASQPSSADSGTVDQGISVITIHQQSASVQTKNKAVDAV